MKPEPKPTDQPVVAETQMIPVKCQNCQRIFHIPVGCFTDGFWHGNIRKTFNFECYQCGWKEKIII